jgi:hypothetical protein
MIDKSQQVSEMFLTVFECSWLPKKISVHQMIVMNAVYLNPYFDIPLDLLNTRSMADIDEMIFSYVRNIHISDVSNILIFSFV